MRRSLIAIGVIFISGGAFALAGCGKVGTLDQPAPLYGEKAKAQYQAKKEAEAAAKAKAKDDNGPDSVTPDRVYDPNADPGPQRAMPTPGAPTLPNAPPPPGVLPDPYNTGNGPG
jgi:hypothetical protein